MKAYQDEKGSATIIEYSVVLPIVLISIMALMYMAFIQFQRAVTESCVERALIYATRVVTDTNYSNYATTEGDKLDLSAFSVSQDQINNDPYRYWRGSFGNEEGAVKAELERLLNQSKLHMFRPATNIEVDISKQMLVFTRIDINVTQEYSILRLFSIIGLPTEGTIEVSGKIYADQPAELIRNSDYAVDIIQQLTGFDLGTTGSEIISKISYLLGKLGIDF